MASVLGVQSILTPLLVGELLPAFVPCPKREPGVRGRPVARSPDSASLPWAWDGNKNSRESLLQGLWGESQAERAPPPLAALGSL